ncbi:hypothetical protein CRENBAI_011845 [Crenichthys baileyi]|uniref:Uncharacterized protein n=1 Tax=Crenichthys baileyi TaxID=28760 RepID=A0AAV9RK27_9TELE
MQDHQHPGQPSINDRAKPSHSSLRANTTATQHILPYIRRGTVKTTNPKHTPGSPTPPTRTSKPHPSTRPRSPMQPLSPALPALQHQHSTARASLHRTTTPTPYHAIQQRTERSKEHPKQKQCTKPLRKCAPTSLPKIKPPSKVHPHEKKTHTIQTQEHMPDTHTPARSSPVRKPTPKPTKGREPKEPKPKPTEKPRPLHPEKNSGQPARPKNTVMEILLFSAPKYSKEIAQRK